MPRGQSRGQERGNPQLPEGVVLESWAALDRYPVFDGPLTERQQQELGLRQDRSPSPGMFGQPALEMLRLSMDPADALYVSVPDGTRVLVDHEGHVRYVEVSGARLVERAEHEACPACPQLLGFPPVSPYAGATRSVMHEPTVSITSVRDSFPDLSSGIAIWMILVAVLTALVVFVVVPVKRWLSSSLRELEGFFTGIEERQAESQGLSVEEYREYKDGKPLTPEQMHRMAVRRSQARQQRMFELDQERQELQLLREEARLVEEKDALLARDPTSPVETVPDALVREVRHLQTSFIADLQSVEAPEFQADVSGLVEELAKSQAKRSTIGHAIKSFFARRKMSTTNLNLAEIARLADNVEAVAQRTQVEPVQRKIEIRRLIDDALLAAVTTRRAACEEAFRQSLLAQGLTLPLYEQKVLDGFSREMEEFRFGLEERRLRLEHDLEMRRLERLRQMAEDK